MKTAIVTGANGGIGKELTMALAKRGFNIIMGCRDKLKGDIVCRQIIKETNHSSIEVMELDLASFHSINQFVKAFQAKHNRLDILLNNAGVLPHQALMTKEGAEYTVGVNYLGHYLLTEQLFPFMSAGTRIVNTGSLMMKYGKISPDFFALNASHFNRFTYYSHSKLALYYATLDWAERWNDKGITVNCVDPGIVDTNIIGMGNKYIDKLCNIFYRPIIRTPQQGADTIIYLATDEQAKNISGKVFKSKRSKSMKMDSVHLLQRNSLKEQTADFLAQHQQ